MSINDGEAGESSPLLRVDTASREGLDLTGRQTASYGQGKGRRPSHVVLSVEQRQEARRPYMRISFVPSCGELLILVVASAAAIANGLVPISFYYFFGSLVGELTDTGEEHTSASEADYAQAIIQHTSFNLFLMAIFAGVSAFIYRSLFTYAGECIVRRMRRSCFNALLTQEVAFFDHTEVGFMMARITEDGGSVRYLYSSTLATLFISFTQLFAGMAFSALLSWKLMLAMLALTPLLGVVMGADSWISLKLEDKRAAASARCLCVLEEVLSNMRIVHAFCQEAKERMRYAQSLWVVRNLNRTAALVWGTSAALMDFLIWGACAFSFFVGGHLVGSGELMFGDLVTVLGMMIFAMMGLSEGVGEFGELLKAFAAYKRIATLATRTPRARPSGTVRRPIKGEVRFDSVCFTYEERERPALSGVSFVVQPGNTLALVGRSGGGKSTILWLLERFYDADSGSITIDGVDLVEYELQWLRQSMAIVTQEPILFSGSVRDNIAYGRDDASDDEIYAAARTANAYEFVSGLPEGFDTPVGEGGALLSGGQKQRLSIARAVLCNPSILLLDEATSALDSHSEAAVQEALARLMVGRTALVIAHRLSTVRHASRILVLHEGRVVESGTHEELSAIPGGAYQTLAAQQHLC